MSASAAVDTALAGSELIVVPDGEAAAMAAAARIADRLALAVAARGRADFATTGGSTPVEIYPHLAAAPLRDEVPWRGVHVWWGDDRFVPRDHPFSNVRPVDDILINVPARSGMSGTGADASDIRGGREPGVVIPVGNIHPFPCTAALARGRGSDWCAAAYADELRAELPTADGWPMFDLVLL
ncbi:MAG TPA: 6-phosphogluconolactonase, partial [Candidatus Limnocylindrales bacterium]